MVCYRGSRPGITKPYPAVATDVKPVDASESLLGKQAKELISEDTKILKDGSVVGTLHYVEQYTDFSNNEEEQSGNYFPMHLNVSSNNGKMTLKKNGVAAENKTDIAYDADIVFRVPEQSTTFSVEIDGKEVVNLNFKKATLESQN